MATTVPDGIWTPDDSTAYNPPIDLAAMADTIQGALNGVRAERADFNQQFYGPAAARAGLTGVKPGDTYQETDAGKLTWIQTAAGLWRVFNTNGPINLALASGWSNPSGPVTFEVRSGMLSLNGRLSGSSAAPSVAATLPVDYRPPAERVGMIVDGGTWKDFIIGVNGSLTFFGKGSNPVNDGRLGTVPAFPIK